MNKTLWIIVSTVALEALAILMRFGLGLESTRDTGWIAQFTFGLRIHHGYIGVALLLAALVMQQSRLRHWMVIGGWILVLTDLIHHFLVLWPLTGDPQFHLIYPTAGQ